MSAQTPSRPGGRAVFHLTLIGLGIVLASGGCGSDPGPTAPVNTPGYPAPEQTGDGWKTASLTHVGMDSVPVVALLDRLEQEDHLVHGLVVARKGRLVLESYHPGEDFDPDDQVAGSGRLVFTPRTFARDSVHFLASAGKVVISTLVGAAIRSGDLAGTGARLFDFFPDHAHLDQGLKSGIEIGHCLTMTSGLPWDDGSYPLYDERNDEYQFLFNPDPTGFVLAKEMFAEPGASFEYNSGTTHLLAEVVETATGESLEDYADRVLFAPLGITSHRWARSNHDDGVFCGGLFLRPRDMAKVGQMMLDGGVWNGTRILDQSWVSAATTSQAPVPQDAVPFPGYAASYGYQWWLGELPASGLEITFAAGWGGQFIIIVPAVDMVVVFTSGGYLQPNFMDLLDMVDGYLVSAVIGEGN